MSLKKRLHRWDGMSQHLFLKEVESETQTALSGVEFDPTPTSREVGLARKNERAARWAAFELAYGEDW